MGRHWHERRHSCHILAILQITICGPGLFFYLGSCNLRWSSEALLCRVFSGQLWVGSWSFFLNNWFELMPAPHLSPPAFHSHLRQNNLKSQIIFVGDLNPGSFCTSPFNDWILQKLSFLLLNVQSEKSQKYSATSIVLAFYKHWYSVHLSFVPGIANCIIPYDDFPFEADSHTTAVSVRAPAVRFWDTEKRSFKDNPVWERLYCISMGGSSRSDYNPFTPNMDSGQETQGDNTSDFTPIWGGRGFSFPSVTSVPCSNRGEIEWPIPCWCETTSSVPKLQRPRAIQWEIARTRNESPQRNFSGLSARAGLIWNWLTIYKKTVRWLCCTAWKI